MNNNASCFFALVDVLGKGAEAAPIANMAAKYLKHNHSLELVPLMQGLHTCLKGTRGAVAALCRINLTNGLFRHVGIGNITLRLLSAQNQHFLSKNGIIGYQISTPQEQQLNLTAGDILILHSDGVKEHIDLYQCRKLLTATSKNLASDMIAHFGKDDDDASCIVVRCSHD